MAVSVLVLSEETAGQDKNRPCLDPDEGAAVASQKKLPDVLQNDSSFTVALFKPHKSYS